MHIIKPKQLRVSLKIDHECDTCDRLQRTAQQKIIKYIEVAVRMFLLKID